MSYMSQRDDLPVIHTKRPDLLPETVAYTIGGGLVPGTADSPDTPKPDLSDLEGLKLTTRLPNGLTVRADAMARWVAHGASLSDAFRAAYADRKNNPAVITNLANMKAKHPSFAPAVANYREKLRDNHSQNSISLVDFVKGRLVLEAQRAKSDAGRIAALRLLGQTESLFTTVHKTERTLDPVQLEGLKAKLDQRLKHALARLGGRPLSSGDTSIEPSGAVLGLPGPRSGGNPLSASGSHAQTTDTNPSRSPGPFSTGSSLLLDAGEPLSGAGPSALGPIPPGSHPVREPNRAIIPPSVWSFLQGTR